MTPNTSLATPTIMAGLDRLVHNYANISPDSLDELASCYAPQARFKDPFNEVQGRAHIRLIFEHMFQTVDQPKFVITTQLLQGQQAFLAWEFHFCMRRWCAGVPQCIRGGTHVQFDEQGLALLHRDYWDAAEELYEKLPLLGALMRKLRQAGSVSLD